MKRVLTLLTVVALTPLIMGGGVAPPPPFATKITGPAVSAVVVMDPHMFGVTTTAKQASIWLMKGTSNAGAVFNIPSFFGLFLGCDLTKTSARFQNTPQHDNRLSDWIRQDTINSLFAQLGITVSSTNVPVITDINNAVCTPDPFNPGPLSGGSVPGMLSFTATVQFEAPQ